MRIKCFLSSSSSACSMYLLSSDCSKVVTCVSIVQFLRKQQIHSGAWKYRNRPERTGMDTGTAPNGQWNGPERTGMDSGMDRNGPEDTKKSLALHPLFDIRIEKSLNIFI